ncbi:hypothetical protein R1flu_028316 [Riccia fluitans]|uniref:Uncharacterized protein n=1 Tax=Riccia fluitans TaxID=41844 RepID=A0ABD1XLB2_9MARC
MYAVRGVSKTARDILPSSLRSTMSSGSDGVIEVEPWHDRCWYSGGVPFCIPTNPKCKAYGLIGWPGVGLPGLWRITPRLYGTRVAPVGFAGSGSHPHALLLEPWRTTVHSSFLDRSFRLVSARHLPSNINETDNSDPRDWSYTALSQERFNHANSWPGEGVSVMIHWVAESRVGFFDRGGATFVLPRWQAARWFPRQRRCRLC